MTKGRLFSQVRLVSLSRGANRSFNRLFIYYTCIKLITKFKLSTSRANFTNITSNYQVGLIQIQKFPRKYSKSGFLNYSNYPAQSLTKFQSSRVLIQNLKLQLYAYLVKLSSSRAIIQILNIQNSRVIFKKWIYSNLNLKFFAP